MAMVCLCSSRILHLLHSIRHRHLQSAVPPRRENNKQNRTAALQPQESSRRPLRDLQERESKMADAQHADEYDEYNYEQDKYMNTGHSGKQRSKKEAAEHTNHQDPSGHTRKIQNKMENMEKNKKPAGGTSNGNAATDKS